jgi:uncharacterized repeat protein (TIGR01451 family)
MPAPLFKRWINELLRCGLKAVRARAWMLALLFVLIGAGAQTASAQMTIKSITWNVIGLDSNKVNVGPDTYPVGARVCNTGATTLNNVAATFFWDTSNIYINLSGNSTMASRALTANTCVDFYFDVTVTRSSSAYNATRQYHITATANGLGAVSTPTPRELYVERLVSQARNQILAITGPTTVYVGNTYTYTVDASTATGGYEQLEAFIHLSNVIFQVQNVSTTYTSPPSATNDKIYADACGWDNNPLSPSYRSCIGPANYTGGKAGNSVRTIYTVKILSTGTTTITSMIYDFSGSSYHYNSDFGNTVLSVTSLPPPLTLSKTANQTLLLSGATVTYTLRLNNTSSYSMTINDFVDTLPTSPASAAYVAGSSTFNGAAITNPTISGSTLTWVGLFSIPAGQTRDLTFQATIPNVVGNYVNNAVAHLEYSQVDTTSDISDNSPASATVQMAAPPNIVLIKCVYSGAQCVTTNTSALAGSDLIYSIGFTNAGGYNASLFVITDRIPANTDFKIGSVINSLGTTGLTATVAYSNDGGSTWTYIPASGGGSAPAGYDRNVTHTRWSFSGNLSQTSPNNIGSIGFTVRIR